MNYKKIYIDLILKVQSEDRKKLKRDDKFFIYYERHHIVPKCMGGENNKSNLVLFTPKEHFVAHKLLAEAYPDVDGLIYAAWNMITCKQKRRQNKVSAREYERIKTAFAEILSKNTKDIPKSEESKLKSSVTLKNKPILTCPHCGFESNSKANMYKWHFENCLKNPENNEEEIRAQRNANHMYKDKSRDPETNKKISVTATGRVCPPRTQEHRDNLSKSGKGKVYSEQGLANIRAGFSKRERVVCPWCQKEGIINSMKQWHFDNCKQNPDYIDRRESLVCPHCGFEGKRNMIQHHFDNCRFK